MEALNDYFALMLLLCLGAGLLGALLNEDARDISILAIGVIFLSSLASPFLSVISELGDIPTPEDSSVIPRGGLADAIEESFVRGVEEYICTEWNVPPEDVEVEVIGFLATEARVSELRVKLFGAGALADTRSMREALLREFALPDGKCTVVIDFG